MAERRSKQKRQPSWRLAKDAERVVRYWRDSLIDAQRSEVRDARKLGVEAPPGDFARGRCTPTIYPALVKASEANRRGGHGVVQDDGPLAVLLCPLLLQRQSEAFSGPRVIEAFWIPAELDRSGRLYPPPRGEPWIPRALLEPMLDDEHPAIGTIDALNEFALSERSQKWREWSEYWEYAERLFAAVTDGALASFECAGFASRRNGIIMPDTTGSSGMFGLHQLYDRVLEGKQPSGLLPEVARRTPPSQRVFVESRRWITKMANRHCGQFGNAFPLAFSQRRAVHRALALTPGEFLCVTGPPGTGKTTMLQSLVASLMVEAVHDERSYPPIIAATGATNQAVTNVITAMEKASSDTSLLASRWIPGVDSYGTFCVSASRAQDAERVEGFQLEQMSGEGLSNSLSDPHFRRQAEATYLANFKSFSGKQLPLRGAVRHLAAMIRRERGALYRAILECRDGSLSEWIKGLVGLRPQKPTAQFFNELAQFDQQRRFVLFLLAARFWEGRWLLEMQQRRADGVNRNSRGQLSTTTADWRCRAMLTPAFVSTLAMLPRFFRYDRDSAQPPIDFLIFDEASQVSPELGAGCLALASRALIVGDDQQLEPVWNVPPHVDLSNASQHELIGRDQNRGLAELTRMGMLASNGSLMRLSLRCSTFNDGGTTVGVFLSEHRRSVPEIVAACNALAYRDRLLPYRPPLSERVLPAFGYLHVRGRMEKVGTSRRNKTEADEIISWLVTNRERLLHFYRSRSLDQVLAVISPFAAQIEYIHTKLRPFRDRILVGTVNSLQGAERPVVLFSTVYDPSFTDQFFFDRGPNMLNVAISRARDSFVVFGDTAIFHGRPNTPSSILGAFLFSREENQLQAVEMAQPMVREEELRTLTSLNEHREALLNAIYEAKRELVIVSPTISINAIKTDRIAERLQEAVARGVKVTVYTDRELDLQNGALKLATIEGRLALLASGVRLAVINGIHNKTIAIDDHTVISGSFNWLSAVRTVGSKHQKYEESNIERGKDIPRRIQQLKDEMSYRGEVDQSHLLVLPEPNVS